MQDYGAVYDDYLKNKNNFKIDLGNSLQNILTVNTKDNIADRKTIFGSPDPTEGGTKTVQSLIDNAKNQLETGFNELQTNFSQITGATTELKALLEKNTAEDIFIKVESSTSFVADEEYNIKLSYRRSDSLLQYVLKNLAKDPSIKPTTLYKWKTPISDLAKNTDQKIEPIEIPISKLGYGDDRSGKLIFEFINKGENSTTSGPVKYDCHNTVINNKTGLKKHAPVTFYCRSVSFELSYSLKPSDKKITIPGKTIVSNGKTEIDVTKKATNRRPPLDVVKRLIMKALSECFYFKKLEETDPLVFGSLKEKLKYFHPAFHSMTPEGLNARLTFLHQCIRPGDTIPVKRLGSELSSGVVDARNTTFGPPPVCILRIGDFYHSKVVITNMNIEYEGSTWDLNPEGIGVQPMLANVTLQVNFIGGQGIKEPVAKLQNALSSNFFANTEVYDYRADSTASGVGDKDVVGFNIDFLEQLAGKVTTPKQSGIDGGTKQTIEGKWVGTPTNTSMDYAKVIDGLTTSANDYFDSFASTYKTLTDSYGKEILPIFISPTYRTVNQLDVYNSISSPIQVNLLGKYRNGTDFSVLHTRLENVLNNKAASSDHNLILDLDFDSGSSKYERSRDIIDPFIKNAVSDFLNKLRDEKAPQQLENRRNLLIQFIDAANFIMKTNGKDAKLDGGQTTVATLTDFDASKFYDSYDEAINLIKDKHTIFTSDLSTSIDFFGPSIDDATYKKILAFIIKDSTAKIVKAYDSSLDKKLFDANTLNKIEKRVEKFIKNNKSDDKVNLKYKKAKVKSKIKPYPFTLTGALNSDESQMFEKLTTKGDQSDDSKLNFLNLT
jgi:hypothetical protein